MKSKYFKIVIILFVIILLVGCEKKVNNNLNEETKNIQIVVYGKNNSLLYNKKTTSTEKKLLEVLKDQKDLTIETETGPYGEFIVSINNNKQADNYYWNYYVNGNYASLGVSDYEIKNEDILTFKLEEFE